MLKFTYGERICSTMAYEDRSLGLCEALIADEGNEYRNEHTEMVSLLERFRVPYKVEVDLHPDEEGPNPSTTFMLWDFETEKFYNATGGEAALLEALRKVREGDAEALACAVQAGHDAAD